MKVTSRDGERTRARHIHKPVASTILYQLYDYLSILFFHYIRETFICYKQKKEKTLVFHTGTYMKCLSSQVLRQNAFQLKDKIWNEQEYYTSIQFLIQYIHSRMELLTKCQILNNFKCYSVHYVYYHPVSATRNNEKLKKNLEFYRPKIILQQVQFRTH